MGPTDGSEQLHAHPGQAAHPPHQIDSRPENTCTMHFDSNRYIPPLVYKSSMSTVSALLLMTGTIPPMHPRRANPRLVPTSRWLALVPAGVPLVWESAGEVDLEHMSATHRTPSQALRKKSPMKSKSLNYRQAPDRTGNGDRSFTSSQTCPLKRHHHRPPCQNYNQRPPP